MYQIILNNALPGLPIAAPLLGGCWIHLFAPVQRSEEIATCWMTHSMALPLGENEQWMTAPFPYPAVQPAGL